MIKLILPFPPSCNHYYGNRRNGQRYIKQSGKAFRGVVLYEVLAAKAANNISSPIKMRIDVYPPDKRRRDIDNINKALLDALENSGVYQDDSQIVRLTMTKYEPVKGGKVIVYINKTKQPVDKAA